MSKVDLNKMNGLLASKGSIVAPAQDAVQRSADKSFEGRKDEKTKESKDEIVNLSFKVPAEFRKRFKLAAVNAGLTQNDLVQQALEHWEQRS